MKFFNIDLHIAVIADIKHILESMGHSVTSWSLSGHNWVFNRKPDKVDVINAKNWRGIDKKMCDDFYNRYKEVLSGYDAFIVTHTPCFAMLYERFEKPVIVVASTRYEEPFGADAARWYRFNTYLRHKIDAGLLVPIANNRYDAAYCELFTGRDWTVIPSLCLYTGMQYSAKNPLFLLAASFPIQIEADFIKPKQQVLPSPYKWEELADFKGIIHFPYNCSTMSLFEQYTANIPLIFPSRRLLMELYAKFHPFGLLSQLSWNQVHSRPPGSSIAYFNGSDEPDPNGFDDLSAMSHWMRLADYYDENWMPHISYFDDFDQIGPLFAGLDTNQISRQMKEANQWRQAEVYRRWQEILDNI